MSQPFFQRLSRRQRGWVADQLRDETVGGGLLLLAAAIALLWANSPWAGSYATLVDLEVGPASVGLNLSLGAWAADGLLSVFFLVVGLELKHELVVGSLSKPSRAAVPIAAALGGMVVPALLFAAVNSTMADGELAGWGIPMATDIAFALAVLAVIGRRLPVALRASCCGPGTGSGGGIRCPWRIPGPSPESTGIQSCGRPRPSVGGPYSRSGPPAHVS